MGEDAKLIIGTELDTTGLEEGLDEIKDDYDDESIDLNTDETETGLKKILNLTKKIGGGLSKAASSSARFVFNLVKTTAKVGAIGALLGVAALAGLGLGKAFEQAIEKDEELQAKVEYLKFVLASAFTSVGSALVNTFKWLIERLYDILGIIGGIIKLLTKFNIFSKATAENFKNANKSAGSLRKTLAGFDEMDVVSESGGSGLFGNIDSYLDDFRNMSTEVDEWAQKIKTWFLGEGNETFGESLKNGLKQLPGQLQEIFEPVQSIILTPVLNAFEIIKKSSEPTWRPIVNELDNAIEKIKEKFTPLLSWLNINIFDKVKSKTTEVKNDILLRFAPLFNTIISWINSTFGIFGIKLDYIEVKSDKTGERLEDNLVTPLEHSKNKADELSKGKYDVNVKTDKVKTVSGFIENIWNRLREITSRTWNVIVTTLFGEQQQPRRSGMGGYAKGGIYYPKLPRLAVGGLINQPGRGIPYHGAVVGERGTEGILPLTDSQQMMALGEAIGKFVNINATVPVYVGNRLVIREMKRISAEDDFAFNR